MGKTILITGISGGIGEACALHFLDNNHRVVGVGRNTNPDLEKHDHFKFYECDLMNNDQLKEISTEINQNEEVDIFIHNAMYTPKHNPFIRYKASDFISAHQVATVAPTIMLQKIGMGMRKRKFGRILFFGSAIQLTGSAGQLPYLTAKSALEGLTKGLALELAGNNVTCNLLLLGPVETKKFKENVSEENQKRIIDSIPEGRLMTPEEVARSLDFFLSEESIVINGASIPLALGSQLRRMK